MTKTQQLIAETLKLSEGATPGPWKQLGAKVVKEPWRTIEAYGAVSRREPRGDFPHGGLSDDMAFIAHARTALPLYAKALERALEALNYASKRYCPNDEYTDGRNCNGCSRCVSITALAEIEKLVGG